MAGTTYISPLMPLAFRPVETNRPTRYLRGHMDTEWQKDLILHFQKDDRYFQKVRRGNRFRFQAKATSNTSRRLFVIDCHGVTVHTFTLSTSTAPASDVDSQGQQYTTYHYKTADLSAITADGTYYLIWEVVYDVSTTRQYISEPIYIADEHPDTICIEYSNSENLSKVLFSEIPAIYTMLVEAYIDTFTPKVASQVYNNQSNDAITLDYRPYRNWKLYVGHTTEGVPDWMIDKLTRIFGCDRVLLDGKLYTGITSGGTFEVQDGQGSPLKAATLDIQEAAASEGFTFTDGALILYAQPSYPYAISGITVGNIHSIIENTEVANSGAQTTAIAQMNTNIGATELLGTVTLTGGNIVYNLAPGETYTTVAAVIHTNKVVFGFTPAGASTISALIGRGNTMMVWGDGAINSYYVNTTTRAIGHSYSGAGIYTVNIWGKPDLLNITHTDLDYQSGLFPPGMKTIYLSGIGWPSNAFQFSSLAQCAATLINLSILNGALTSAPGFNAQLLPVLKLINFSDNPFSTTNKSLFHYDVWLNANNASIGNGTFTCLQTPYVPLNALGNTYKLALQSPPLSWTVNT